MRCGAGGRRRRTRVPFDPARVSPRRRSRGGTAGGRPGDSDHAGGSVGQTAPASQSERAPIGARPTLRPGSRGAHAGRPDGGTRAVPLLPGSRLSGVLHDPAGAPSAQGTPARTGATSGVGFAQPAQGVRFPRQGPEADRRPDNRRPDNRRPGSRVQSDWTQPDRAPCNRARCDQTPSADRAIWAGCLGSLHPVERGESRGGGGLRQIGPRVASRFF